MTKQTGLGQGVNLLFGNDEEKYFDCDVMAIKPNKFQPRITFKEQDLKDLAQSIKENGVIQPLIVTSTDSPGEYELIAGERRLRASKLAGLSEVPVVVMDVKSEDTLLELALIENIQRTDLNAIEEAEAYRKLIDKFGYTQEETAKRVGKKRSTITNMLRLLNLPDSIKTDVVEGILSEGHGRSLVKLIEEPVKLHEVRNLIIKNRLSVRQTEKIIRKLTANGKATKVLAQTANENNLPESYRKSLVNQLTNKLNSKVQIHQNGNRGKIEIEYYSIDDLERLISLFVDDNS